VKLRLEPFLASSFSVRKHYILTGKTVREGWLRWLISQSAFHQ
jgi:hypothetical protein